MHVRRLAMATLTIGLVPAVVGLASAHADIGPVATPPLPIPVTVPPLPPITVPPLPPPLPTPTLPATPTSPAPVPAPGDGTTPSSPSTPGALPGAVTGVLGSGGLPSGSSALPVDPRTGLPTSAAGVSALDPSVLTGPGLDSLGGGAPSLADPAALANAQATLDQVLDIVTTTVCQVLTTVSTAAGPALTPALQAVDGAVDQLPASQVGTGLGGAVGFRLDLQALSELPARTLLDFAVHLPGILTVDLSLPECPEAQGPDTGGGLGGGPGRTTHLIPPSNVSRRLGIVGTPVAVTRPAPALPSHPAFTG